jgi:rod shape-determining protein MreD
VQPFKIVATLAVALLLQLILAGYIRFFGYIDLPLLVTIYFGLQRAPVLGMIVGLAAGLGGDIISGGVLGVGGFTKTIIGYLVAIASVKLSLENRLVRLLVVAAVSIANTLLFVGLYQVLEQSLPHTDSLQELIKTIGWKTLADTAAALVVFILLDGVFKPSAGMAIKRRFYE